MKKLLAVLFLFTFLHAAPLSAQCPIYAKIPDSVIYDVEKLGLALTQNVEKENDKACHIFQWIRTNIKYDSEAYRRNKKRINATTADVLKRREAVCLGYSQLFAEMCQAAGLNAMVIDGYSKQGAIPPDMEEGDHAWNAVQIDGQWYLADVTWAADSRGETYFCSPPEDFIKEHLPADPMWQLLDHPVSADQFRQGTVTPQKTYPAFSFSDSIKVFLELSPANQKIKSAENAYIFNPTGSNRELLGHAYVDFALSMTPEAERLQSSGSMDSLTLLQLEMIRFFRLAHQYTALLDWQRDNFANILINQAVSYAAQLPNAPSFPEAKEILDQMKNLLLEAKNLLEQEKIEHFPSHTLEICEEYLKWVETYWD
ncbi:MAG: hypothetical protein KDC85_01380 [Saprospiraceae bacterium]|nr:hypothetical protein [Saprospiraceae bacterium]MCB9326798.1 hypothetical protein [Lewinellaceae bacterium]